MVAPNSLGFAKRPEDTRVVVAMSGGVDSSVVSALLKREGYDVIGITLQLYDHGAATAKKGACCAGKDVADARAVAAKLAIPHYVLDYESRFRDAVVQDFADTYAAGRTPIPCVRCNQTVKFRDLMATAKELGAEALATGHYVRRVEGAAGPELWRGADDNKDQSYFLFATTPEQLSLLRFPLGDKSKSETRELATEFGLTVAFKPDSQDICFVPNGSYVGIVEKLRPDAARAGNIVHVDGRVLGRHEGIIHYTIGQRKGIGIGGGVEASGEALYVVAVDAARAEVTVGPKRVLARDIVRVSEVNWLGGAEINMRVEVKLRSAQPAVPATLSRDAATGRAVITLDEPLYGIAPGQACVFYSGARVLGGGWIDSAESSREAA